MSTTTTELTQQEVIERAADDFLGRMEPGTWYDAESDDFFLLISEHLALARHAMERHSRQGPKAPASRWAGQFCCARLFRS